MKKCNAQLRFALFLVIGFALWMTVPAPSSAGDVNAGTLDNLQAAFNGESNAHAKYLAYSKKAEEEGYLKVAALFRAAAYAEEIHLNNHARVIKSLGASPKAEIKQFDVKSTELNLVDAIKGETYEQNEMYPGFIAQAKKEQNEEAIQTFNYAMKAEAEHAKLYKGALDNLTNWKVAEAGFAVCPICGYTVEGKPTFTNCPVCGTPANDYKLII